MITLLYIGFITALLYKEDGSCSSAFYKEKSPHLMRT